MRRKTVERINRSLLVLMVVVAAFVIGLLSGARLPALPFSMGGELVSPLLHPGKKVGIVAGHWPDDVGAICPDGTMEVDINHAIAVRVVGSLRRYGYRAELLSEFDPGLEGYEAGAFVAIHADSCIPGASGFKVARAEQSAVPEEEDRLVDCLYTEYEEATGLGRHEGSITPDMRYYHSFRRIAPETPGAIIEMGFMADDATLLLERQELVAQGIVKGILCFLERSD
jgi:N-acetylmuramoyl-L-alanine amidase